MYVYLQFLLLTISIYLNDKGNKKTPIKVNKYANENIYFDFFFNSKYVISCYEFIPFIGYL